MIGERLNEMKRTQAIDAQTKKARFIVRVGDVYPESTRNVVLTDVYLSVAPGSILGISGVSGNGQDILFDVLTGS